MSYPFQATPGVGSCGATNLVTKVELRVSCLGLLDRDTLSKSDPLAALYVKTADNHWKEYGRTERLENTLNPDFAKAFHIDYHFEEVQHLKFSVFDLDNSTKGLDDDDPLGELTCTLAQIVSNKVYTKPLVHKSVKNAGTITISAEELKGSNEEVTLKFRAEKLDNKDFLGKSDPFLEILRDRGDGQMHSIWRTEVVKDNLNPNWKPIVMTSQTLHGGNYEAPIQIRCFDYDDDGGHDLIGECHTRFNEMVQGAKEQVRWDCINEKKRQKKKSYKNSGVIVLESVKITKLHSFLDFVMGGCQINFTVGIDFTGSNGDPAHPQSLHYYNSPEPTEYMKALMAVGEVCQDYDSDKMFPALGFGGVPPGATQVSFEFPLNFNPQNPYCAGIGGLAIAYQNAIRQVALSGPTNVAPIIRHVSRFAEQASRESTASNYFILLLLTDGILTDMAETKAAIIDASFLPMSVIIVGIGMADFKDMDALDCDTGRLNVHGRYACRDIVQFVPFRKFKMATPAMVSQAVLAEVPKQVTEYFKIKGIQPGLPMRP